VLLDPPWRRVAVPSNEPATSIVEPVQTPPSLHWQPGEQDAFLGSPIKSLAGRADEALFDRLLDQMDARRPLPLVDVKRLSDKRIAELGEEVVADSIDAATLCHMLSRIGDDFVARAVELVLASLPERGLFDAMAPVRASSLARRAAAQLPRRRDDIEQMLRTGNGRVRGTFVPSGAERWLERHARAAIGGLASVGADRAHSGHEPARMALGWIAVVDGQATGIAALDGEFAPLRPLAGCDFTDELAWLPILVASGLERAALTLLGEHALLAAAPWVAHAASGSAREQALAWLVRHDAAVRPLLVDHGDASTADVLRALDGDTTAGDPGLEDVPTAVPPLPDWLDLSSLPCPMLKGREPLPADTVVALAEMLRFTSLARPYAGVAQVKRGCDAESLDAFALALLHSWREHGEQARDRWILDACGAVGADGCARAIHQLIAGWSRAAKLPQRGWDEEVHRVVTSEEGDRNWNFSLTAVDVLAAIGSDLALTALDELAGHGVQSWLRKAARRALDGVLRGRKLRREQLDDAIVPNIGLDDDGSMRLSLGERTCRVGFDEQLTPRLVDGEGKRLKSFPRRRKSDDAEAFEAAKERFAALRRDAKVLARQQIRQLETAMNRQRSWDRETFVQRFVEHPLLRHLGYRLLWEIDDGSLRFRIAEDGSFADARDEPTTLPAKARVRLIHPISLRDESRAAWSERFEDYEILQPFPQLGRPVHRLHDDDHGQTRLVRYAGASTTGGRLFALRRRGWSSRSGGAEMTRELPGGSDAWIRLSPPFTSDRGGEHAYEIGEAWCVDTLNRLPAIDYSELIGDLDYLTD
jgi:Domain of unknown function (DUF4132)